MPQPATPLSSAAAAAPEAAPTVVVELFAGIAAAAGCRRVAIPWTDGAVGTLRRALEQRYPALAPLLARSAFAHGDRYVADDECLAPGATVALIPPVSGG